MAPFDFTISIPEPDETKEGSHFWMLRQVLDCAHYSMESWNAGLRVGIQELLNSQGHQLERLQHGLAVAAKAALEGYQGPDYDRKLAAAMAIVQQCVELSRPPRRPAPKPATEPVVESTSMVILPERPRRLWPRRHQG